MTTLPDIKTAISLWQKSLSGNCSWNSDICCREYIYHTNGVGDAALKIAQNCNMDSNKAYILGLLHDYGKIQNEKTSGISHFIFGYKEMMNFGFDEVARICLTHSFPHKKINFNNYSQYNIKDLEFAQNIISGIEYDDYDRLIQLCDMFFEANKCISYQKRISCIQQRYNLQETQTSELAEGTAQNKLYFDKKCGCDIYNILGIKE